MHLWPTPDEERALALGQPSPWRRLSIIMQSVLFILTAVGIIALYWLSDELSLSKGWVALFVCVAVAEFLIQRARFWRTGVEAALWIGGLFAFIFSLPSSEKPEAILVFAAAAAIAGWRVRNALFGTLAFVLCTVYLIAKEWPWTTLGFSMLVTLVALFALTRSLRHPSTEELWEVAVVVMPIAGYVGIKTEAVPDLRVIAMYVGLAALLWSVAVRFRSRVLLIAMVVAVAIAGVEARNLVPLSDELRLIVAGTLVLAVATMLMRALRGKQTGFVIGTEKTSELHDVLTAAPALMPMQHPADSGAPADPQGGEFGGAGAGGSY